MRKFTKMMLTLALLFGAVGGVSSVKARPVSADLSKLSTIGGTNATWDGTNNTITWVDKSNNMVTNLSFAAGDYKLYSKIGISVSDLNNANFVRVEIRANGKNKVFYAGDGVTEKYLIADLGFTAADLENFEWARILGSNWDDNTHTINGDNPASAKINSVYLEFPEKTLNVDLSKMAASKNEATWDFENKTFGWKLNYSNSIELPGLTGNLSGFTQFNYNTAEGTCDHFRIIVYYSNGTPQTTYQANVGTKSVSFDEIGVTKANLAFVSSINISGAGDVTNGNIILNSFSLYGPELNYIEAEEFIEAPAGTTDIKNLNNVTYGNNGSDWTKTIVYPRELAVQGDAFGDGSSGNGGQYVSIEGYDYIAFYVSKASSNSAGYRVWIWDDVNSTVKELFPYPIANYKTAKFDTYTKITGPGTYVVNVTGYKYLKGVKASNDWGSPSSTVSMAYAGSGDPVAYTSTGKYTLYGELSGTSSLLSALSDANATYYDATGVAGEGVNLEPTNSNALFKANAGKVTNSKNVIVGSSCANLELKDGEPFKAPSAFTATNAKFTRKFSSADYATMVVPFDVATLPTQPATVKAYKLKGVNGEAITTDVLTSLTANEPVMVKVTADDVNSYEFTATDVTVPATPDGLVENGLLKATYTTTTAAADANNYVLQKNGDDVNDVNFYLVTGTSATVKPFRAYLHYENPGAHILSILFDDATGIEKVEKDASVKENGEFFNLAGQRVAHPTKGLYIVNGKKVVIK